MKKLDILKLAAEIVVSVGVGAVVGNAIKASTPADVTLIKKVCIGVGGFVLSSMTVQMATAYTEQQIDAIATEIENVLASQPQ